MQARDVEPLRQGSAVASFRVNIPLLSRLVPNGIKPGTVLVVEFDPDSQWFAVASTVAASYLQENGHVAYGAMGRPLDDVKQDLMALGAEVTSLVNEKRLLIDDWYSASLTGGRLEEAKEQFGIFEPIETGIRAHSLKVADLSVEWLKSAKGQPPKAWEILRKWDPGWILVIESLSTLLRFNEERVFAEWLETRENAEARMIKRINLEGFVRGVHSEWLYKRIEAAADGVIDIRVMEHDGEAKNFLRLRSLRGQPHDARWHEVEINENGEATLTS